MLLQLQKFTSDSSSSSQQRLNFLILNEMLKMTNCELRMSSSSYKESKMWWLFKKMKLYNQIFFHVCEKQSKFDIMIILIILRKQNWNLISIYNMKLLKTVSEKFSNCFEKTLQSEIHLSEYTKSSLCQLLYHKNTLSCCSMQLNWIQCFINCLKKNWCEDVNLYFSAKYHHFQAEFCYNYEKSIC